MDPNQLQKNSQNCSWLRHIIINNMVSFNGRDFKERNEKIKPKQNFELENQRGFDQDHWQFVTSRRKKMQGDYKQFDESCKQFASQQHDVGIKSLKIEKTHKIRIV